MPVYGMRIDRVEASRNNQVKIEDSVRIGSAPRILSLSETQVTSGTGKINVLEVAFEYQTNYDPAIGSIRVDGAVIYQEGEEKRKKIVSMWKEEKKFSQDFSTEILTHLTQRTMLISMHLARELGLPSPLPMRITSPGEVEQQKS
ncbi:MAG: hypothetical protein ACXQTP_03420 [Candidatus Methanofastidiosia archaeon]